MSKSLATTLPGIYAIINLLNGKRYIGSACNIRRRWAEHRSHLNRNIHSSKHLNNAWLKYGSDCFEFRVIELVNDKTKLTEREQIWLDNAKPEYNYQTIAGRGNAGMKRGPLSEEHKAKLSAARKGKPLPPEQRARLAEINRNKTPEWRKKISESKKGTIISEETRKKMSQAQKGRKHSPETIEKMRAAHAGKPKTEAHRKALSESRLKLFNKSSLALSCQTP
jgi:group I intron endonuclease